MCCATVLYDVNNVYIPALVNFSNVYIQRYGKNLKPKSRFCFSISIYKTTVMMVSVCCDCYEGRFDHLRYNFQ